MSEAVPVALVVDDDEQMRALVEYALVSQGFHVECAASAAEAWAMVRAASYDVAIVDVVMPGISGTVLCSQIGRPSASRPSCSPRLANRSIV